MTPTPSGAPRWAASDRWVAVALALCAWAMRAPFVYRGGMGDGDSMVIAAGIARGLSPEVALADAVPYGRQVSPGIVLLMRAIGPWVLRRPDQTLPFLNGLGVAAAALLALPLYALYRRWLTAAAAATCTVLVLTAPLVWEVGTYFHPIVPAVLLLLAALLTWERIGPSAAGVGYTLLTLALAAAALLMRAEVALVAPALALHALASPRRWRYLALLAAMGITAVLVFLAVVGFLAEAAATPPTSLRQYVYEFAVSYFRPRAMLRNAVWAPMAVGLGTLALVALGLLRRFGRPRPGPPRAPQAVTRADALASLVWVGVPALFWLPNPVPLMRHFLLLVPAVVGWAGWLWSPTVHAREVLAWGGLAAALNVTLPEAIHGLAARARPDRHYAPYGTFFAHHRALSAQHRRLGRLVAEVAHMTARPAPVDTPGAAPDAAPAATAGAATTALVEVDWDGFGHVSYWLATTAPPWSSCGVPVPGVRAPGTHCFRRGDAVLELVLSPYDLDVPALSAAVRRVRDGGGQVLLTPRALQALGPDMLDLGVRAFD